MLLRSLKHLVEMVDKQKPRFIKHMYQICIGSIIFTSFDDVRYAHGFIDRSYGAVSAGLRKAHLAI